MLKNREPITLIIPPSPFLMDERVFMSLGILKVGASLKRCGYELDLIDLSGRTDYETVLLEYLSSSKTLLFGLTSTTPQLPGTIKIARLLREARKDARLILGGPHATLTNAARRGEVSAGIYGRACRAFAQLENTFDVIVCGDGELAIMTALDPASPKLIDADSVDSELFLSSNDFDELPFPDRSLIDVHSYRFRIDNVPGLSLIAQLGCPFACGFCAGRTSASFRRIRLRSPSSVTREMRHLYDTYGTRAFMFYDDELNVNPAMVHLMEEIVRLQDELNVNFLLRGCVKAELLTEQQAVALSEAGFRTILVGFESGAPRILTNINKKASVDDNTRCLEIARRHGLRVKALMSIGHPGESPETIEETYRWLVSVKPDEFDVTIITVLPGTHYYDRAVPHSNRCGVWTYTAAGTGDRLHSYEIDFTEIMNYYKGDRAKGYESYVFTDFLEPNDLVQAREYIDNEARAAFRGDENLGEITLDYDHSMGQLGRVFKI